MSTQAKNAPVMPAIASARSPGLASAVEMQHVNEPWQIDSQRLKDEQIQAFCREYAKRIATALTQHSGVGGAASSGASAGEFTHDTGKEHIVWPSPEALMELYTKLLRDNQDPKIREVMSDQSFVVSSFATSLAEKLEQQLGQSRQQQLSRQREACGCGIDHGDHGPLDFPEDSYDEEPDEQDFDGEDEDDEDEDDEDEDDEDFDDEDDEDDEDEEDSLDEDDDYDEDYEDEIEQDVIDGYAHHYAEDSISAFALEEEKRMFAAILQVQNDKKLLQEGFRKKQLQDAQKRKQEEVRIQLLQKLRLEDEERRRREQLDRERREKAEQEMRMKREADEADQAARTFLFWSVSKGHSDVVRRLVEASPEDSRSIPGAPGFATPSAVCLTGWESLSEVEAAPKASKGHGMQETLLHVAARTGRVDLVIFLLEKGAPIDALDSAGLMPIHRAAEHNAPLEICRLLTERAPHCIDRHCGATGKTALQYAAKNGNGELVMMLLQHNAKPNVVDSAGRSPEDLAKAGLDREKSSKAKAQKYRVALHHIQKAMAPIKELQRQKTAQLEEERNRMEMRAREEAELDRAARRKQEEKLEADLRRREEDDRELARLKALAADPHGHNGGSAGGSKKKKKKKGKGNDAQASNKEAPSIKSLSTPAHNILAKSASPSPIASPAIIHTSPAQKLSSSQSAKPASIISTTSPGTTSTSTPASASPSSMNLVSEPTPLLNASPLASIPPATPVASQPTPSRLPKAKTTYRPSQLVVTRMADMGFPARHARKALIQTEGRFEEAIELLTSGAPLADDSEDEAERAAEKAAAEAARRSAKAKEAAALAASVKKQDSSTRTQPSKVQATTKAAAQPASSQATSTTSVVSNLLAQHTSHTAIPKEHVAHPVQILQRPHAVSPHVQMRSVPTQVLQRPSAHAQTLTAGSLRKSVPTQGSSAPLNASTPTRSTGTSAISQEPFLAPRTMPPPPPTRAPYSYGSSTINTQTQGQLPSSATITPTISSNIRQDDHPTTHPADSAVPPFVFIPTSSEEQYSRTHPSLELGLSNNYHLPSLPDIGSSDHANPAYADTKSTWETHLGIQATTETSPMAQSNLWGAVAQPIMGFANEYSPGSLPSSSLTTVNAAGSRRSSFALLAASMDDMLRQSQMDMDSGADGDMIKDVLAMTGALDPDEIEHTIAAYPLDDSTGSASRFGARPSVAVGEGRAAAAASAIRNPVASLWEYGSFTQDISSIGQTWTSTHSSGSRTEEILGEYDPWTSGSGFEMPPRNTSLSASPSGTIGGHRGSRAAAPSLSVGLGTGGGTFSQIGESHSLSPGIQALNNALTYARYPKLSQPESSSSSAFDIRNT